MIITKPSVIHVHRMRVQKFVDVSGVCWACLSKEGLGVCHACQVTDGI